MTLKDAILATILEEDDRRIAGRTLLQKKLYFVGVLRNEDFGYAPHYYGPYSARVSDELGSLVSAGFVSEETDSLPGGDSRFGERRRYRYSLTSAFDAIQTDLRERLSSFTPTLQLINGDQISKNIELISVAAKVHLILSRRREGSVDDIKIEARHLGWDLDDSKIDRVAAYLERLDLIERT